MTKVRPPLHIGQALDRIAGFLPNGWQDMATVCGVDSAHTVRAWGDPDKPERQLSLERAIALDIAYQRAGGDGRPLFETYALQVEVAREQAFACEVELARRTCAVIRESGQAHEAMVNATLPSATQADREKAIRELEDVLREVTSSIALLRSPRAPDTS